MRNEQQQFPGGLGGEPNGLAMMDDGTSSSFIAGTAGMFSLWFSAILIAAFTSPKCEAGRSRLWFQPSSMPARAASTDVVDFTTMACNVSCVLLPSWANVTVRASTAFSVILQDDHRYL